MPYQTGYQMPQQTAYQMPGGPDPAYGPPGATGAWQQAGPPKCWDAQSIRQMVPQLAHMSDEFLLSQPIDSIYRLAREEKKSDESKSAKGLEAKLYNNFKKASENTIYLAGYDNRANTLHPARFLPGAGVPVQNLWLEARKQWGQEGADPIGNYDLEALACSGCVTARGWELLHKPGSPEMSLRMFTVANIGHLDSAARTVSLIGEDGIAIHENLKEFADMAEFKRAMRNIRLAAHLATPWNFSYEVIDGFLQSNNYMEGKLGDLKKATVLSAFVDHALKVNAALWVQEAPFMDSAKLMTLWNSWWSSRRVIAKSDQAAKQSTGNGGGGNNNNKNQYKKGGKGGGFQGGFQGGHQGGFNGGFQGGFQGGPGPQNGGGGPWAQFLRFNGPPNESNICRRFNDKQCPNSWFGCGIRTQKGPIKMYHLCIMMVKKDGGKSEFCLGKHPRQEHKDGN